VGYGDISPVTPAGRAVAVVLMVFGIGIAGTLAASVGAFFVSEGAQSETAEIVARLDRIELALWKLSGPVVPEANKDQELARPN
jgi:voltage-gated potassium channel